MSSETTSRLLHGAVTVSSEERARAIFEDLFGLERLKSSEAGPELTRTLFEMEGEARFLLYGAAGASVEVFVWPGRPPREPTYDHLCLAVADPAELCGRALGLGLAVRRFSKPSGEVVFLRDLDGNLYEIKRA